MKTLTRLEAISISVALLLAVPVFSPVQAATRHVNPDNPAPAEPYDSWATAATNIQDAVDVAVAGDTVLVTNGVYAIDGRAVNGTTLNRVAVTNAITVRSVNGSGVTTITGQGTPGAITRGVWLASDARLEGFTVTGGYADVDGLRENNGHPVDMCGGGVCGADTSAVVTNCVLTGNWAGMFGGGAHDCTLQNCVLANNRISDDMFTTGLFGGGANACVLWNCSIIGNIAAGNRQLGCGGGAYDSSLYNCTLSQNVSGVGGGTYNCTLRNCFLNGNSARYGGGSYGGSVLNCTLAFNTAFNWMDTDACAGGGIYGATAYNCIVWGNTCWGALADMEWSDSVLLYSCTRPLPPGEGNIDTNPLFVNPDVIYGGAPSPNADYRLKSRSPCINAGTNQEWMTDAVDLDGRSRIQDGVVDMGAYERPLWAVHYVTVDNVTPVAPYTNWCTAATNIQDAVDAATDGDIVIVSDGVYSTGGRVVVSKRMNRVAVPSAITIRSVNGPRSAIIEGQGPTGTLVRGVWLAADARLEGFTITGGFAKNNQIAPGFPAEDSISDDGSGGGVFGADISAVVTNCVLTGNMASDFGGGAHGCTLQNCSLVENTVFGVGTFGVARGGGASACLLWNCALVSNGVASASGSDSGGGACDSTLQDCVLSGNGATSGGGVDNCDLENCILTGNEADEYGGGANGGLLCNCTVVGNTSWRGYGGSGVYGVTAVNCIIWNNHASGARGGGLGNWADSTLSFCCTYPLPRGVGNIKANPMFVSDGDLHLRLRSPCINRGRNQELMVDQLDLDGNPRISGRAVDMGAYEFTPQRPTHSRQWFEWCEYYYGIHR